MIKSDVSLPPSTSTTSQQKIFAPRFGIYLITYEPNCSLGCQTADSPTTWKKKKKKVAAGHSVYVSLEGFQKYPECWSEARRKLRLCRNSRHSCAFRLRRAELMLEDVCCLTVNHPATWWPVFVSAADSRMGPALTDN